MSVPQRFPFLPRLAVALMSVLLVSVVGMTFATAQSSEPVSTGSLTAPGVTDGVANDETITVRGAGYAPGSSIEITIESDPILLGTVRADATGSFVATVKVPANLAPGRHTLKATGPDPAGGLRILSVPVTLSAQSAGGTLPRTGSDLLPFALVGPAAIAAGSALLLVRRRHSRRS